VHSLQVGLNLFSSADAEKPRLDGRIGRAAARHAAVAATRLRCPAASLLARAGVPDDQIDRVLGHEMAGVKGTYNRHDYAAEKASGRQPGQWS